MAVEIPDRLAQLIRPASRAAPVHAGLVEVVEDPVVDVRKRPIEEALRFFHNPEHDASTTGIDPLAFHIPLEKARTLASQESEAQEIADIVWYHTIELPNGVVTPGEYDHRPLVPYYGLPDDLSGKRALDIGTNNGFWAFELERRGAAVTTVDVAKVSQLDFPPGARDKLLEKEIDLPVDRGFRAAHRLLGSSVQPLTSSVYDLDPSEVGTFDFVHIGMLLLHLRDPLAALERVRSVTSGEALIVEVFDPSVASGATRYLGGWQVVTWWLPSLDTLAQMVLDAGFSDVRVERSVRLRHALGPGHWQAVLRATP